MPGLAVARASIPASESFGQSDSSSEYSILQPLESSTSASPVTPGQEERSSSSSWGTARSDPTKSGVTAKRHRAALNSCNFGSLATVARLEMLQPDTSSLRRSGHFATAAARVASVAVVPRRLSSCSGGAWEPISSRRDSGSSVVAVVVSPRRCVSSAAPAEKSVASNVPCCLKVYCSWVWPLAESAGSRVRGYRSRADRGRSSFGVVVKVLHPDLGSRRSGNVTEYVSLRHHPEAR
mmetsp:Transcript_25201/g.71041  ORF Transcript_25201/g.71041 Transcript_25201/m.71041 type:complete len:237 (+) Transcript_25201:582-1292(+)